MALEYVWRSRGIVVNFDSLQTRALLENGNSDKQNIRKLVKKYAEKYNVS